MLLRYRAAGLVGVFGLFVLVLAFYYLVGHVWIVDMVEGGLVTRWSCWAGGGCSGWN
jgi:hypothetical protein